MLEKKRLKIEFTINDIGLLRLIKSLKDILETTNFIN
jgi:hypothetical protein